MTSTVTRPAYPVWSTLPEATRKWLATEQQRLELEAVDRGIERYRQAMATDPTLRTPEQRLVTEAMGTLVPAVEARQKALIEAMPRTGRPPSTAPALLALSAEKVALVTLQVMIRKSDGSSVTGVYDQIATEIKREITYEAIRKANAEVYKKALLHTKRWTPEKIAKTARKAGVGRMRWSMENRIRLGCELLNLATKHTKLFKVARVRDRNKLSLLLFLTDETADRLASMHERMEILSPVLMPMVIPPREWDNRLRDGGYLYDTQPCVQTGFYDHKQEQDCPLVRDAVNYCQSTAWRINRRVFEVAETLWKRGGGVAGLVRANKHHIPPKPAGPWKSPEVVEWRKAAAEIHRKHAEESSHRVMTAFQIDFARKLLDRPAIWFPHRMCFRSRMYTNATSLQPQGNDLCRGLLEFAEAKPPGERGVRALKIHLANCFGVDKVPFRERIEWSDSFLSRYTTGNLTYDPFEDRRWMDADDPFGALAAVLGCLSVSERGAHLPVSVDGTCNGIQHLSALGLDRIGAASTNLLHAERPADLYRSVLEVVNRLIDEDCSRIPYDAADPHPCWAWRGRTSRNVTKQPIMTTPYGVTHVGMRSQIISNGCCDGLQGRPYQLAAYMQEKIDEAIGSVIVASKEIMGWLREVAKATGERGHPVTWTTPNGFIVNQSYTKKRSRTVNISSQRVRILVPDAEAKVSQWAQVRGLPPNYIHSLDATHMQATALRCAQEDVTFAATHDSFKTHACDVDRMGTLLREEFVAMYQTDQLNAFRDEVMRRTGVTLPTCPTRGDLDITDVMNSEYIFS